MGPVQISDRDRPFFLNRRKRDFIIFQPSYEAGVGADAEVAKKSQKAALAQLTSSVFNLQMTERSDGSRRQRRLEI
ncbi:hypothetical protein [Sphingopyxis italica]|jgi:hypothetical protein|uniref:hypothetical protein n=1 Tax=Sphingopyxis italica TaxID=1129133 RepID=UPI0014399172|nr:hypothetical protein [Sphingopyxis italica]